MSTSSLHEIPTDVNGSWLQSAYKQEQDYDVETKVNRDMIERAIGALNILAPHLEFVAFPSGTRVSFCHRCPEKLIY